MEVVKGERKLQKKQFRDTWISTSCGPRYHYVLFEQSTIGTGWTKHEMAPGLMSTPVCYKNGVFQKLCIANQRNLKMPALQMNMWTGKIFENRPMGGHPLNFRKKIEDKKASREGIKNHPLPSAQGLDLALVTSTRFKMSTSFPEPFTPWERDCSNVSGSVWTGPDMSSLEPSSLFAKYFRGSSSF